MRIAQNTFLLLLFIMVTGCTPQTATPQGETPAEVAFTETAPAPSQTATPEPSATPQQGKVILYAPAGSAVQPWQEALGELSAAAGLTLEAVNDLQPASMTPEVRIVAALSAPSNLTELVSAAPQVQFLVASGADFPASSNLTVIRQRPEYQAFLAGYIAVMLSTDWRAAGLLPEDSSLGVGLQDAFVNGGRYFCGLCGPGWPLGVYYPQVTQLPSASDGNAWQGAAAGLYDNMKVEVFYLSDEASEAEVYAYIQGRDQFGKLLLVVGTQSPPDELRSQWAATVSMDSIAALRQAWPDVMTGNGGGIFEVPVTLENVNSDNLSEGKLRLVNKVIEGLSSGMIYPFSVPLE